MKILEMKINQIYGTRERSKQHMSLNSTAPVTLLDTEGAPLAVYNRGLGTRLGCFDQ